MAVQEDVSITRNELCQTFFVFTAPWPYCIPSAYHRSVALPFVQRTGSEGCAGKQAMETLWAQHLERGGACGAADLQNSSSKIWESWVGR